MPGQLKTHFLSATAMGAALCCATLSANAATIEGNVSPWALSSAKAGTAPDNRVVDIAVHLKLRNLADLKKVVASVSKPGSAEYGHYLSKADIAARYAPDSADVDAVKALLSKAGMSGIKVGPAGVYVGARATVAQLRSTFSVSQDLYTYRSQNLRANREAPSIPAALSGKIVYIEGLDDTTLLKRPNHHSVVQGERVAPANVVRGDDTVTPPPVAANLPSPYCSTYFDGSKVTLSKAAAPYGKTIPWLACGYTPQQIQQAYGLNKVKEDGTGVTVAILDAYGSPTIQQDGTAYAANHGLPALTSANFSQIVPEGIYSVTEAESADCGGDYGWWGEESLDVAAVHGAAPGATIVYVGAADCGTALTEALENVIYNQIADIATNSYSFTGDVGAAAEASQDQDFIVADSQGQTLLFSSGDDGDISQVIGVATGSYESTSPYVTGVGGTSLKLHNSKGQKTEVGWGNARDFLKDVTVNSATSVTTSGLTKTKYEGTKYDAFSFYSGAGGGISLDEAQPDYQKGVVPKALATTEYIASGFSVQLSKPMRVAPDVSMVADPYTGYLYGESFTIAGNAIADAGCTPTSGTVEYCEESIGGTSLASPLMAAVLARVDQARKAAGNPVVGFANPWLYGNTIGTTMNSAGINDILPPAKPEAVLRGYASNLHEMRLVTLNSVPFAIYTSPYPLVVCADKICEGLNDVFNYTTVGYDDVTGLGVPFGPALVTQ